METERNGKKSRNQILSLSLSLFLIFPSRPKFSPGGSPLKTNYDASRCPRIAREGHRGRGCPSRRPVGEQGRGPQGPPTDAMHGIIGEEERPAGPRRARPQARGRDVGFERRCVKM